MKPKKRFTDDVLAVIHKEKILGIRAGRDSTHRVIGIWSVVVERRVFVRSWSYRNHTSTGGREPRNFAISPEGAFLLVANQKTNNIVTFKIDPGTGQLFKTGHEVEVSMPVCLKFAYLNPRYGVGV